MIILISACSKKVQVNQTSNAPDPSSSDTASTLSIEGRKPQYPIGNEKNLPLLIPERSYQSFQSLIFDDSGERSYDRLIFDEVNRLYRMNGNRTIWLGVDQPDDRLEIYHEIASKLWSDGLDVTDYRINELYRKVHRAYAEGDTSKLTQLDFQLSFSFFLLSHHLAYGKINPHRLDSLWFVDERKTKVFDSGDLFEIRSKSDLEEYFQRIRPPHEQYHLLKEQLEDITYQKVAEGSLPPLNLDAETVLVRGDRGASVLRMRKRLSWRYPSLLKADDPQLFDQELFNAVVSFQKSHGIKADGIVGAQTLAFLNAPVENVLDRIKINMERIRWMPRDFGENYLLVNIPDFSLQLYENKQQVMDMKIIVGEKMNKTPVFSDTLEYLVFSPTWVIPQSIKVKEMLPRLKEDSSYYSGRDYIFYKSWTSTEEVDPREVDWSIIDSTNFVYNVVQQPGPTNALGRVKFIMPNDLYIYLHDTPADKLFAESERTFSHGCIRVEKPLELAEELLSDQFFLPEVKVKRLIQMDEPQKIYLDKKYHVQIMYRTVWVDQNGVLQQRKDIYELDPVQLKLLSGV